MICKHQTFDTFLPGSGPDLNIVDMSDIIHQLTQEGAQIREDDIATLSPYLTGHIKRFGDYHIDLKQIPSKIAGTSKELGFVQWGQ